ncbi:MAG: signal peptidase I [Proteobacteria bacterium]|nr:signal peptidase I [Pseudomonadota bacterium]
MENREQRTTRRLLVLRIAKPLLVALVVVSVIKVFVLEAYRIPSGSMESTLVPGDFVLVNKLAFGLRTPKEIPILGLSLPALTLIPGKDVRRGDVVVFAFKKTPPGITSPVARSSSKELSACRAIRLWSRDQTSGSMADRFTCLAGPRRGLALLPTHTLARSWFRRRARWWLSLESIWLNGRN